MKEGTPNPIEYTAEEKEARRIRKVALAAEIIKNREFFPFPGISPDAYSRMKADEEEFPGYVTPIDDLIKKFTEEEMKFGLGKNPESGNVFVLPGSPGGYIEDDSIFPRQLQINETMDERLKELILLDRD